MIGIEITGTRELINDLNQYGKDAEKAVNKAIKETASEIEKESKSILRAYLERSGIFIVNKSGKKAQAYRGHGGAGLLGSIKQKAVNAMEYIVVAAKDYAAYIEFGIGEMVFTSKQFTAEEKQWAAQYKGSKKVKGFKGVSYLGTATLNQEKKHVERIEKELNKLKAAQ